MRFSTLTFVSLFSISATPVLATQRNSNTIYRDVAIIGGGSAGTYASFALLDRNASVIVLERQSRLGGHTETYHDPKTGKTVDIGVNLFHDQPHVRDYFGRFGVKLKTWQMGGSTERKLADFRTGQPIPASIPDNAKLQAAIQRYAAQVARYPSLANGWYLPKPIPEDLLMPVKEFVEKYELQDAVQLFWSFSIFADLMELPTVYLMRYFTLELIMGLSSVILTSEKGNNSELYEKAYAELKKAGNVLLNANIRSVKRRGRESGKSAHYPVEISVAGKGGRRTIVRAKKVLITAPPTLKNVEGWLDLTRTEKDLFKSFKSVGLYVGLLRDSGIPDNVELNNVSGDLPYGLPSIPGVYGIFPAGIPGLHNFQYGSLQQLSEEAVKKDVLATLARLQKTGVIDSANTTVRPSFAIYRSHTPYELNVNASLIQDGFYDKLYGLQGKDNTYWSGAAFLGHDSSDLWRFTTGVVNDVVEELGKK